MGYNVLDETDDFYKLGHPDGTQYTVAKNGLDQSTLDSIDTLPRSKSDLDPKSEAFSQNSSFSPSNPNPFSTQSPQPSYQLPPMDLSQQASAQQGSDYGQNQYTQAPIVPNPEMQPSAQASPVVPAVTPPSAQPGFASKLPPELANIYGQQATGYQQQAQAQSAGQQQQAKIYQDAVNQVQQTAAEFNKQREQLNQERQNIINDIQNDKYDPERVWSQASTGSKIAAGIGIVLGGIGQGMIGGRNQALDVIQGIINRDMDSQKMEMNKKDNLLKFNMQKYGDLQTAENATRLQQLAVTQGLLNKTAAQTGSKQALAQSKVMQGQLEAQMLPLANQIAVKQAMGRIASGGGQAGIADLEKVPDEFKERLVKLPNGRYLPATTKEGATKSNETLTVLDALEKGVQKSQDFSDKIGRTVGVHVPLVGDLETANSALGKGIQADLLTNMNKLEDLKRINPFEAEQFQRLAKDPGSWNKEKVDKMNDFLRQKISEKRNSEIGQYLEGYDSSKANQLESGMQPPVRK